MRSGIIASSHVEAAGGPFSTSPPLQYASDISIANGAPLGSGARAIPTVFVPVAPGRWYEYRRNATMGGNAGSRLYGPSYNYVSGNSVIQGRTSGNAVWTAGGFVSGAEWDAYRFQVPSGVAFFKFIDEANLLLQTVTISEVSGP